MKHKKDVSRRQALTYGAGLLGTGTLVGWLGKPVTAANEPNASANLSKSELIAADPHAPKSNISPDEALRKLMEGNQRFVESKRINPNQDTIRVSEVAAGQAPFAAILSCADSRVVPEMVFDQGIGDLFVVRIAGNIAMIEDVASEEYAIGVLGSSLLMVLGHQNCGAVAAAIKGGTLPGVIESLVYAIQPAVTSSEGQPGDRLTNAIIANVKLQVERLMTSTVISEAVKAGKLKIVGAYYELQTGKITLVT